MCRGDVELAALQDDAFYLQVPYPCKIFVWVRKCADGDRGRPYLRELGRDAIINL
jgi:hypothetical protein